MVLPVRQCLIFLTAIMSEKCTNEAASFEAAFAAPCPGSIGNSFQVICLKMCSTSTGSRNEVLTVSFYSDIDSF